MSKTVISEQLYGGYPRFFHLCKRNLYGLLGIVIQQSPHPLLKGSGNAVKEGGRTLGFALAKGFIRPWTYPPT